MHSLRECRYDVCMGVWFEHEEEQVQLLQGSAGMDGDCCRVIHCDGRSIWGYFGVTYGWLLLLRELTEIIRKADTTMYYIIVVSAFFAGVY